MCAIVLTQAIQRGLCNFKIMPEDSIFRSVLAFLFSIQFALMHQHLSWNKITDDSATYFFTNMSSGKPYSSTIQKKFCGRGGGVMGRNHDKHPLNIMQRTCYCTRHQILLLTVRNILLLVQTSYFYTTHLILSAHHNPQTVLSR